MGMGLQYQEKRADVRTDYYNYSLPLLFPTFVIVPLVAILHLDVLVWFLLSVLVYPVPSMSELELFQLTK